MINPIVWIDLELTGLNQKKDLIIEIAVIISDGTLNTIIEGPNLVIKTEKEVLDKMCDWCQVTHSKSGLIKKCLESNITIEEAQKCVLEFMKSNGIKPQEACLGGNSIHMDRLFLLEQMPQLVEYLHYRIIDVSSFKEMARRVKPELLIEVQKIKTESHRALDDIRQSIEELKIYLKEWK